jgi:acetate---CoA ligase (ADP-forming)
MRPGADARDRALAVLGGCGPRLTEHEAKELLSCFGIRVTREAIALSASAGATCARQIGFPVALKAMSPDLRDKRAAGALTLGVRNAAEVRVAYARVLQRARQHDARARLEGVLVAEMVARGIDVTLGFSRAKGEIWFGLGGLLGVAAGDVARKRPPLSRAAARAMVREVPGVARVLEAHGDPTALADLIERFSTLVVDLPQMVAIETDVHALPRGQGYVVVDAWAERRGP